MPKLPAKSIPLLCNLCPKHPRFSDVSHLLTHISSKSHLSNRFKLQIRSQAEPQARRQLEDFDNWYAEYGLEDLLSERLSAKENKKVMTKQPRVASILPKVEHKQHEQLTENPVYRPPVPRMHTWSTGTELNPTPLSHPLTWDQEATYTTPTMQRTLPNFAQSETPLFSRTNSEYPSPAKPDGVEEESDLDTSKLKGVLWPGMDLFDSATAEMKRMRNQRKDRSVLEQMKLNSADVEPTELVFDSNGELRKARHIFDDATDSGLEETEAAPTPKKRRVRKSLLTEISTNIPRRRPTNSDNISRVSTKRKTIDAGADDAPKRGTAYHNSRKAQRSTYAPSTEEDEEFRLTMEGLANKSKFGVFRDEDNSPGRTESPLEEHRFDFSSDLTMESKSASQNSPTPLFKPIAMHYVGKENIQPEHLTRRMRPQTNGFPPQVFHNDSFNPLLYHAHSNTFAYGDHMGYSTDTKQPASSFHGDFKPLPMVHPFQGISSAHGLPRYGIGEDMPFGI